MTAFVALLNIVSRRQNIPSGLRLALLELTPRPAIAAQILAVHNNRVIETVRAAAARGGRIALVLEGGYDPAALSACVVGALAVLAGQAGVEDQLGPAGVGEPAVDALIERIERRHPAFLSARMGWM